MANHDKLALMLATQKGYSMKGRREKESQNIVSWPPVQSEMPNFRANNPGNKQNLGGT